MLTVTLSMPEIQPKKDDNLSAFRELMRNRMLAKKYANAQNSIQRLSRFLELLLERGIAYMQR